MPPGEVDGLELGEDSLDEERKIPLKLMRRGERGGDSFREECLSEFSTSPSRSGMAKELRSGMCTRSDRLFRLGFFLPLLPPGLETSFFFLVSMAALPITLARS